MRVWSKSDMSTSKVHSTSLAFFGSSAVEKLWQGLLYLSNVIGTLPSRIWTEVLANWLAIQHGHELVSSAAAVLFGLNLPWLLMMFVWDDGWKCTIVFAVAQLGFFISAYITDEFYGGLCLCLTFFISNALLQLWAGMCEGGIRVCMFVTPMLASLLLKNSTVTTLWWLGAVVNMLYIDFIYFDECEQDRSKGSYWYYLSIDCSFHFMVLCFSLCHIHQYRLHDALQAQVLRNMSQELRTPLFGVVCAAEVLGQGDPP